MTMKKEGLSQIPKYSYKCFIETFGNLIQLTFPKYLFSEPLQG